MFINVHNQFNFIKARQMTLKAVFNKLEVLTTSSISKNLYGSIDAASIKKAERWIINHGINFNSLDESEIIDEHGRKATTVVMENIIRSARKKRKLVLYASIHTTSLKLTTLFIHDHRGKRRWILLRSKSPTHEELAECLNTLANFEKKNIILIPTGSIVSNFRKLCNFKKTNEIIKTNNYSLRICLELYSDSIKEMSFYIVKKSKFKFSKKLSHLDRLEAESIHIMREVVAEARKPVMLYSIGKDSSVMLHIAKKAFYPGIPPFPLLHVDTMWKFKAMYDFRDFIVNTNGMDLIVHVNQDGVNNNINPFDHGSGLHTDIMKTQGLKQALEFHKFDFAFGGARRDEEKSRAKERIFSFRSSSHQWDPKNQRPELWHLFNCQKKETENIRVFPISNWTELDIWQYIYREQIPIVPLYFAKDRPFVERNGMLLMVDDDRFKLKIGESIKIIQARFRTLGCYPLTGAIESSAKDLGSIILETLNSKTSERQGRSVDADTSSMEQKKQEGYF